MPKAHSSMFLALVGLLLSQWAAGQEAPGSPPKYYTPPKEILELAESPRTPLVFLSPDNRMMAVLDVPTMVPISELAGPELKLAGLRFNPHTAEQSDIPQGRGCLSRRGPPIPGQAGSDDAQIQTNVAFGGPLLRESRRSAR